MKENECRRLVRKHMPSMMRGLGVSEWTVDLYYEKVDSDDAPSGFSNQMALDTNYRYEKAGLTINCEVIPDEKTLLQGLRHEMIHLTLAPMEAFNNYLRKYVGEQPEGTWKAIEDSWQEHLERAVLNVERMLDFGLGLTPEKVIATARRRWDDPEAKSKKKKKKKRKR